MSLLARIRASATTTLTIAVAALGLTGCALLDSAAPASASHGQLAIFEDPLLEATSPALSDANLQKRLQILRSLGVGVLRIDLAWTNVAPAPNSRTRPAFNASDPNSYNWAFYDRLVNAAHADGLAVDFLVTGGPSATPLWATQPGAPSPNRANGSLFAYDHVWQPSASEYGQFVHAVASHFQSVHFWEIWDEPNWGPALAPQTQGGTIVAAGLYRSLLDAGWSSLQSTGHGHDTIVVGNYTQYGSQVPTTTNSSFPISFTQALYCMNSSYQRLTGQAATAVGCPTSGFASSFRGGHPALFFASGFGVHPYQVFNPPNKPDYPNANAVEYNEIPHFLSVLDRLQKAYGSNKRMTAYNTEYGYQTRPPTHGRTPTPATAAAWLNEAEYIGWKNRRIGSYEQYELTDLGWFNTGLITGGGSPKATFYAWRLPIWLPSTSQRRGGSLEVWGDVRPAHFAPGTQYAFVQFAGGNSGHFSTIKRLRIGNSRGYLDVRIKFPSSGQVRIAWSYPAGQHNLYNTLNSRQTLIYSRATAVRVG
jgi:hypothetical protein